jgi:prepilin-type N-terminal cleavage/methylation domain-containing protein
MQRGFMLIELVLVIAIIAIAAALVFPQIGDWIAAYDLNIAARQLAADLRLLQQLSINSDGVFPILHLRVTSPYGYYTDLRTKVIQPLSPSQ